MGRVQACWNGEIGQRALAPDLVVLVTEGPDPAAGRMWVVSHVLGYRQIPDEMSELAEVPEQLRELPMVTDGTDKRSHWGQAYHPRCAHFRHQHHQAGEKPTSAFCVPKDLPVLDTELLGEPAEVVDLPQLRLAAHPGGAGLPVGKNTTHTASGRGRWL